MIVNYSPKLNLYAPRVELYKDIADSLFHDVYEQAKKSILNVLEVSRQAHNYKTQIKECNGIIAFTGDRGSGKTSAMLTIAGLLMENGSDWLGSSAHFEVLPTIDPSHLSKDETILDVVISRLYTQFNEAVNNREQTNEVTAFDKQRYLLKEFAKAHDAIRAHNQSHEKRLDIENSIENLTRLAAGNNLRSVLYHLIEEYFRFKTNSNRNSAIPNFLVLCIDDLDLNINMGYEICEEIRKYFNLPNVIVLFSAKLSQLTDLIKQRYLSDLEVLIREDFSYHVEDMATKYIEKLIPVTRRCTMPRFNVQTISATQLLRVDKATKEPVNYVDEILYLLFAKTGVILLKNRFGSHHFIPTNLRAMLHLLSLLDSMASVELLTDDKDPKINTLSEQQKIVLKNNLSQLETYLSDHNIRENLSSAYQQILLDMLEINWEELSQRVARMIFDNKLSGNSANDADGIMDICDPDTLPENVSIGDALYMLDKVAKQQNTFEAKVFRSIAKMIYSIRLVQLTFLADDGYKSLRQLLGGLIYNPQGTELVRSRRDFQADLQFDEISIAPLNPYDETIQNVNDLAIGFLDADDEKNIDSGISSDYLPYYFWLELHTVSVGRSYAKADIPRWRRSDWFAPYYIQNEWLLVHSQRYLTISYLAVITNSITHNAFNSESEWAIAFNEWRKKYITTIPVFSADIIMHVTNHLRIETEKQLKNRSSGSDYYDAVTRAVLKIVETELRLLPPGTLLNEWMKNAVACPLWIDKRWEFHKGIDGIWYSEDERKTGRIGVVLSNSEQTEQIVQIRRLRNRCTNKLAGIAATQNVASLQTAVTRNISISGMTQLPPEIRKTALQIQEYIKSIRISLKTLNAKSDIVDIKNSLLNEIQRLITAIDNYHG